MYYRTLDNKIKILNIWKKPYISRNEENKGSRRKGKHFSGIKPKLSKSCYRSRSKKRKIAEKTWTSAWVKVYPNLQCDKIKHIPHIPAEI